MNRESAKANQLKREGTCHPRPEKVRADLVAQSPFFDANDLVQMKYESNYSGARPERAGT